MTVAALPARRGVAVGDGTAVAVLALVTVLAIAWAVVAGGWNEGMSISLAVGAVAVVEAALIAGSSAGRLAATLAAPVLGVLVIVPLTLSGMPHDGGPATLAHVAGRYAVALTTGLVSSQSWSFIVGICAGMWLLGFWTSWVAVRERLGVLAVLPGYFVLASNVINAPHPAQTAVPEALALGASIALLARCELAALEWRWSRQRVVALPGTRRRYTAVAVAATMGALVVGVTLPPLTNTDMSGRIFHFTINDLGTGGGGGTGTGGGGGGGGQAAGSIAFSPDTRPGGPLVDNPRPVLAFTADTSQTVYLRAVTDVIFDAGNWYPADATGTITAVPESGSTLTRDRTPADGGVSALATDVSVRIVLVAGGAESGGDRALFPGEPQSIDRAATAYGVSLPGRTLLTIDRVTVTGGYGGNGTLLTTGTVPSATEAALRTAGTGYPSWLTDSGYLDTHTAPQDRPQLDDIAALARKWVAGYTNAYDQARALEAHLRSSPFSYTLSPPPAPAGEWPIHYFLTTGHLGYCQYYASSMGLMLRLLGIPARLVSGYGNGTVDDSASTARSVLHRVTTSDAHVWVEAYFPGAGWVPFEPTPSSQYGVYDPIPRPGAAAASTPSPSAGAPTPTPSAGATPTATPDTGAAAGAPTGATIPPQLLEGAVGLTVATLLAVLLVSWVVRPRSLAALWRRVALFGRLLGVRRRHSETAIDYAGRVAAALPEDSISLTHRHGGGPTTGRRVRERTTESLTQIAALTGKADFSVTGLTRQESVRWRRAWSRVARAIPVLLWRRLLRGYRPAG